MHYSIGINGVSIYKDAAAKKINRPEYYLGWNELGIYRNVMKNAPRQEAIRIMREKGSGPFQEEIIARYKSGKTNIPPSVQEKPLSGYRIVIDPGHFGSDSATSRMEDKYIDFNIPTGRDSERVTFFEAALTFKTASFLADSLNKLGAMVLLTRQAPGLTAFGKTFEQWKKDDYTRTLDSLLKIYPSDKNLHVLKMGRIKDDKAVFRYVFRDAELRKRSEIINAFKPDLTIIIHFNVDEANKDWKKPTTKNFSMAFVGGAFEAGELSDPERRFDFLRLMLTNDLEESVRASGIAAKHFKEKLHVPLAKRTDAAYLVQSCVPAGEPGVFCRNLSLTRLVQGPLIYGETLYQDNLIECKRFDADCNARIERAEASRVKQVADAYVAAILEWRME